MKCIDCAYFEFDIVCGRVVDICTNVQKYIPPTSYANEEHECKFFTEKSGISKWDSFREEEKEQLLKEFDKMYYEDKESFCIVRNTYTYEQAKEMFVNHMKSKDKNAK